MRLETVRMIADWLADGDTGVNARLQTVPRDAGDPLPPAIVAVYDTTRHEHVVLRREPPALPCLLVMTEGEVAVMGEEQTGQYRQTIEPFTVIVRYMTQGGGDAAAAVRDGEYTLRATARSIYQLLRNANVAARERNSVCIYALDRLGYVPVRENVGEAVVAGALVLDLTLRDAAPLTL